ncbi:MAG: preprotein translocase subunit SecG [Flavobacteriales bacterium]
MILLGVLIVLVCVLLAITVMVQNPKGGGLSSTFGGGNQVLGVHRTTNFLEKMTWAMAIALLALILSTHMMNPNANVETQQLNQDLLEEAAVPAAGSDQLINDLESETPAAPATTPETEQ